MFKYSTLLLFISVGFSQLSVEGKRIYNHEINNYYSDAEFIKILNSDSNFVNNHYFINFKKYAHTSKRKKRLMYLYCFLVMNAAINDPEGIKKNIGPSILMPLPFYIYFSYERNHALFNVIQEYNNIYSKGEKNYENYVRIDLGKAVQKSLKKVTPQQVIIGGCIGGWIGARVLWKYMVENWPG